MESGDNLRVRVSAGSGSHSLAGFVAAIASVLMGVAVMVWAFIGAVVISATVGTAAVARGVSLMMSGFSERNHLDRKRAAAA